MKAIKVLVTVFALCVMASTPALQAQGQSQGKGKAHQNQIDKISATVGGLSYMQQYAIGAILDNAQSQVDALAPSDRRTKGGDIRKAAMAQVRQNLTPAQQKKFDAGH
jgi:hypothetical protein